MALTEFQAKAIWIALRTMFRGQDFNLNVVDECLKVCGGISMRNDTYSALRPLDRIDFSQMSPEFREELWLKVLDLFDYPEFKQWNFWGQVEKPRRHLHQLVTAFLKIKPGGAS